jgi:hypothetical protein
VQTRTILLARLPPGGAGAVRGLVKTWSGDLLSVVIFAKPTRPARWWRS